MKTFARFFHLLASPFYEDSRELWRLRREIETRWVPLEEHAEVMESVINIMALVGVTEDNCPPKEKPSQTVAREIERIKYERDTALARAEKAEAERDEWRTAAIDEQRKRESEIDILRVLAAAVKRASDEADLWRSRYDDLDRR